MDEEFKREVLLQVAGYGITTAVLLVLLLVDLIIPDPVPVLDEVILALGTGLAGSKTKNALK